MTSPTQFDENTSAKEVASAFRDQIEGKTVLITGCSVGTIGYATADAIAAEGVGLLVISGRSMEKLDAIADRLLTDYPRLQLRKVIMDLSFQESVRRAAEEVSRRPEHIDVLICNAGLMALPAREFSQDGIEMTFAANHIGHWLFTNLIMHKLRAAAQTSMHSNSTRIINVSSLGHMYSPIRFSDYNFTCGVPVPAEEAPNWDRLLWRGSKQTVGYEAMVAYGQSKTANVLFSLRVRGGAPMLNELPEHVLKEFPTMKSIEQGASTTLFAAFSPDLYSVNGVFLSDCKVCEAEEWATNPETAKRLWKLSEQLTGQEFQV